MQGQRMKFIRHRRISQKTFLRLLLFPGTQDPIDPPQVKPEPAVHA